MQSGIFPPPILRIKRNSGYVNGAGELRIEYGKIQTAVAVGGENRELATGCPLITNSSLEFRNLLLQFVYLLLPSSHTFSHRR